MGALRELLPWGAWPWIRIADWHRKSCETGASGNPVVMWLALTDYCPAVNRAPLPKGLVRQ